MIAVVTGTCPACNGSGRMPVPEEIRQYAVANGWWNYRAGDDKVTCTNCGGQTMSGRATGVVRCRPDGSPCRHEYAGRNAGKCLVTYTCKHCGHSFDIDSSD